MFQYYRIENGRLVDAGDESGTIWLCFSPTLEEREHLLGRFELDRYTLQSALDPDELARIDYGIENTGIICKWPRCASQSEQDAFEVTSCGFFLSSDHLVLVADEPIPLPDLMMPSRQTRDFRDVILSLIHHSMLHFHHHFSLIKEVADRIENRLMSSMNSKLLTDLFNLQKNLTYYENALGYNMVLIERMHRDRERLGFSTAQLELLDDLTVDNTQCYKQAAIVATILKNMTDTMGSLINNKLSAIMKRLTLISLIFLPINAIAGIGGMSEFTTFTEPYMKWYYAYGILTAVLLLIGYLTYVVLSLFEND